MPTQKKIETVNELTDKVDRAKAIILADYRGLKHKQLEDLRTILKKTEAELVVTKNRLLKIALGKEKTTLVASLLEQPTITLFAYADEVTPIKQLLMYFKNAALGKPKGGLLGTQVLTDEDVGRLATIPSRQMLLGKLAGQLNAPIRGLHYALSWNINKFVWGLNAIKNSKS